MPDDKKEAENSAVATAIAAANAALAARNQQTQTETAARPPTTTTTTSSSSRSSSAPINYTELGNSQRKQEQVEAGWPAYATKQDLESKGFVLLGNTYVSDNSTYSLDPRTGLYSAGYAPSAVQRQQAANARATQGKTTQAVAQAAAPPSPGPAPTLPMGAFNNYYDIAKTSGATPQPSALGAAGALVTGRDMRTPDGYKFLNAAPRMGWQNIRFGGGKGDIPDILQRGYPGTTPVTGAFVENTYDPRTVFQQSTNNDGYITPWDLNGTQPGGGNASLYATGYQTGEVRGDGVGLGFNYGTNDPNYASSGILPSYGLAVTGDPVADSITAANLIQQREAMVSSGMSLDQANAILQDHGASQQEIMNLQPGQSDYYEAGGRDGSVTRMDNGGFEFKTNQFAKGGTITAIPGFADGGVVEELPQYYDDGQPVYSTPSSNTTGKSQVDWAGKVAAPASSVQPMSVSDREREYMRENLTPYTPPPNPIKVADNFKPNVAQGYGAQWGRQSGPTSADAIADLKRFNASRGLDVNGWPLGSTSAPDYVAPTPTTPPVVNPLPGERPEGNLPTPPQQNPYPGGPLPGGGSSAPTATLPPWWQSAMEQAGLDSLLQSDAYKWRIAGLNGPTGVDLGLTDDASKLPGLAPGFYYRPFDRSGAVQNTQNSLAMLGQTGNVQNLRDQIASLQDQAYQADAGSRSTYYSQIDALQEQLNRAVQAENYRKQLGVLQGSRLPGFAAGGSIMAGGMGGGRKSLVTPEPITGVGQMSGKPYFEIGEVAPERADVMGNKLNVTPLPGMSYGQKSSRIPLGIMSSALRGLNARAVR